MNSKTLTIGLVACLTCLVPQFAHAGDWEILGAKVVAHGTDRDVIPVGIRDGRFVKIKLLVHQRGIKIHDFKIHFANGDVKDVAVRKFIPVDGETRVVDLPGNKRFIEKVTVIYETHGLRRGRRAKVSVWGKRGVAALAPMPQGKKPAVTWVSLGVKKVSFRVDRDVIPVTITEGVFRKLKLKVTGSPIRFRDLKVHFGNGEVMDVKIRQHVKPGSATRVIDLPGTNRVIKKVVLWYDTRGYRGRATVHLFGGK